MLGGRAEALNFHKAKPTCISEQYLDVVLVITKCRDVLVWPGVGPDLVFAGPGFTLQSVFEFFWRGPGFKKKTVQVFTSSPGPVRSEFHFHLLFSSF